MVWDSLCVCYLLCPALHLAFSDHPSGFASIYHSEIPFDMFGFVCLNVFLFLHCIWKSFICCRNLCQQLSSFCITDCSVVFWLPNVADENSLSIACCCWDGLFDFGILKFHSNVLKCEFFVIIFIELGFVVLPESEDLCLSSTLKGFLSLYLPCMFFNNSCYLYFSTSLFCISEL